MFFYGCGYSGSPRVPGVWLFDSDKGLEGECGGAENPSFGILETTPNRRNVIYASCELEDRAKLALFSLDEKGIPSFVESVDFEGASGTCYVLRHPSGKCIYGADYNSGSICSCMLNSDGSFGSPWPLVQHGGHGPSRNENDPNNGRQAASHVHTLSFVPGTQILAAVDLGEDAIYLYNPDADGRIGDDRLSGKVEMPPGYGPRIVAYHPHIRLACVVCELSCKILLMTFDESGRKWTMLESHGLVDGHPSDWTDPKAKEGIDMREYPPLAAHAEFSGDGRFLYVSTRGTNTMAIFAIDEDGHAKRLDAVSCGGHGPRHFAISPDQSMLAVANQASNEITLFSRDVHTGFIKKKASMPCTQPSCVIWR